MDQLLRRNSLQNRTRMMGNGAVLLDKPVFKVLGCLGVFLALFICLNPYLFPGAMSGISEGYFLLLGATKTLFLPAIVLFGCAGRDRTSVSGALRESKRVPMLLSLPLVVMIPFLLLYGGTFWINLTPALELQLSGAEMLAWRHSYEINSAFVYILIATIFVLAAYRIFVRGSHAAKSHLFCIAGCLYAVECIQWFFAQVDDIFLFVGYIPKICIPVLMGAVLTVVACKLENRK